MKAPCQTEPVGSFGKFSLLEKLADGCLGPIYRAIDPDLGRTVALRVVIDGIKWDGDTEARFTHEFQSLAGLQHPNIATVLEVGKEGQSPYIVTEFLEGNDLGTLISRKSVMPWEAKLSIMIKVAEGLSHAHKNGILHRDLRPVKIHLNSSGGVKIRDFGIAHVLMRYLPHAGVRWGAPIYLSPEQIQHKECDEQADMFSAGIVFYELLTYLHPFHDRNSNKALDNILFDTQIPTFDQFPDAPPGIWAILKKCLAKDPADRYRNMAEFSSACRELLRDLADDSQLMLAELHAALPRLRKAAAQPGISESIVQLLHDIQRLALTNQEADYAFLDRLMTTLIEQYPEIQAVSGTPPATDVLHPALSPELPEAGIAAPAEIRAPSVGQSSEQKEESLPAETDEPTALPPLSAQALEQPAAGASEESAGGKTPLAGKMPDNQRKDGGRDLEEREPSGGSLLPSTVMITGVRERAEPAVLSRVDLTPAPPREIRQSPGARRESSVASDAPSIYRPRKIAKPAYRTAAALLAVLLIVVAVYVSRGAGMAPSTHFPNWLAKAISRFHQPSPLPAEGDSSAPGAEGSQKRADELSVQVLLKEARALADQNRFEESRVFIRRILEIDPLCEAAIVILNEINAASSAADGVRQSDDAFRKQLARVSTLITSGRLQSARVELDKLERLYPQAPDVLALRKRLEAVGSRMTSEQIRKEEEQREAARRQSEDEWIRRVEGFLARGRYEEAQNLSGLWLSEDPSSSAAREFRTRIEAAQSSLKAYESAFAESRYQDALNALSNAEQANPADLRLVELRRRVEARKAVARAALTVYRLGDKAALLLDGKSIGKEGEVENESIPIGSHTLSIEYQGGFNVSSAQEFLDGQRVVYVYDSARRQLRPMVEADRELLSRRRAMEESHRFTVEHTHGWLRGSCKGTLLVDYLEVEYKPDSGSHGFRLPFSRLKLRVQGKLLDFLFASDDRDFQSFRLQDAQAAENFRQIWNRLSAIGR